MDDEGRIVSEDDAAIAIQIKIAVELMMAYSNPSPHLGVIGASPLL
jgi:hypothetical protein